ncbi:MAG: hypothetical protein GY754_03735 [bacterium]|nr:hypothetical protein [bacterium]
MIKKPVLLVLLIFSLVFITCSTRKDGPDGYWVDDNTYRLAASAMSTLGPDNLGGSRREASKKAAIFNAQNQILEYFKKLKPKESNPGIRNFAAAKEVKQLVKRGAVIKVTYDQEDNCEVIYEVKARGLKKKAALAVWPQ